MDLTFLAIDTAYLIFINSETAAIIIKVLNSQLYVGVQIFNVNIYMYNEIFHKAKFGENYYLILTYD